MKFTETSLPGAFLIDVEPIYDERGFFARTWCRREFEAHGLVTALAQCSLSFNRFKGTLRGMHYQAPPNDEAKIMTCRAGAVFDVIIDLRADSPTFKRWLGVELTAADRRMLYAPPGFAHGFLTLEDDTEIAYQISAFYAPEGGRGIRWNDPAFGIQWPGPVRVISPRDQRYPDFAS